MKTKTGRSERCAILFIAHDASRTGAPILLLNVIRWLRTAIPNHFKVMLRDGGPLESQFREVAEVVKPGDKQCLNDVGLIYSNTITNGLFLRSLSYGDIPIITHVHELEYVIDYYGQENIKEVKQHSAHYIACSNATAESLIRNQGIDSSKVSIVPEALFLSDIALKSRSQPGIRESLGIGPDDLVIAGCGTLDLRKGSDLFIQLAEYCRLRKRTNGTAKFLWIGSTGNPAWDVLQRDSKKLSSLDLHFLGELENPFPYLEAADVFCLPSREDPFPLVMLEAGALGKPTLAFKQSGGAEEFCSQGGGFAVPYLDVAGMGDWILNHFSDRNTLFQMGRKAQELVQARYTFDVTGPQIVPIIKRFMRPDASAGAGFSQLFLPGAAEYSEEASIRKQVSASKWNKMAFVFRSEGIENSLSVRFDPLDRIAVIEISKLVLKSAKTGHTLWKAETPEGFNAIRVEGTAVRVPDSKFLKLLSIGLDPILCLPALKTEEQEFKLELVMRADPNEWAIVQHWEAMLKYQREYNGLCSQVQQQQKQLADSLDKAEKFGLALVFSRAPTRGRPIYIWGTGSAGRYLAEAMGKQGYTFRGFIDRDPEKAGQRLFEHSIFEPTVLMRRTKKRPFVIVGSQFHREIGRRLAKLGYSKGIDYAPSPFL
jgi:glycosyltransferase involved in cell wall biosynthesis